MFSLTVAFSKFGRVSLFYLSESAFGWLVFCIMIVYIIKFNACKIDFNTF